MAAWHVVAAVEAATARVGGIDVPVNNAGYGHPGPATAAQAATAVPRSA